MKRAHKKSASAVCRLFIDNPGDVRCQLTATGEHVYTWAGGEIAAVRDDCVAPVVWLDNGDCLPWKLEWIEHDDDNERWYIRRKPDEQ